MREVVIFVIVQTEAEPSVVILLYIIRMYVPFHVLILVEASINDVQDFFMDDSIEDAFQILHTFYLRLLKTDGRGVRWKKKLVFQVRG